MPFLIFKFDNCAFHAKNTIKLGVCSAKQYHELAGKAVSFMLLQFNVTNALSFRNEVCGRKFGRIYNRDNMF